MKPRLIKVQEPSKPKRPTVGRLPGLGVGAEETKPPPASNVPIRATPIEALQSLFGNGADGTKGRAKLPGLQPGKGSKRTIGTEEKEQQAAVSGLHLAGVRVFVSTIRLKATQAHCKNCGASWWQPPNYATGQTPGIPDLLVARQNWRHRFLPWGLIQGIEMKGVSETGRKGALQPEQKVCRAEGVYPVAYSREAAVATVAITDRFWAYINACDNLVCADRAVRLLNGNQEALRQLEQARQEVDRLETELQAERAALKPKTSKSKIISKRKTQ